MSDSSTFSFDAFITAVDEKRLTEELRWYELAEVLWQQSAGLNKRLGDAPI